MDRSRQRAIRLRGVGEEIVEESECASTLSLIHGRAREEVSRQERHRASGGLQEKPRGLELRRRSGRLSCLIEGKGFAEQPVAGRQALQTFRVAQRTIDGPDGIGRERFSIRVQQGLADHARQDDDAAGFAGIIAQRLRPPQWQVHTLHRGPDLLGKRRHRAGDGFEIARGRGSMKCRLDVPPLRGGCGAGSNCTNAFTRVVGPLAGAVQTQVVRIGPFGQVEDAEGFDDHRSIEPGRQQGGIGIDRSIDGGQRGNECLVVRSLRLRREYDRQIVPNGRRRSGARNEGEPLLRVDRISQKNRGDGLLVIVGVRCEQSQSANAQLGVALRRVSDRPRYRKRPVDLQDGQTASDRETAVLGILGAEDNGFGITGICPDATIGVGVFERFSARTIAHVEKRLPAGSVIVIPFDRDGPGGRPIPIEWWEDDAVAIATAVTHGIIVVCAAGNGSANLKNNRYNTPDKRFSSKWKNPFLRNPDSGSILVGAGRTPSGALGPDRSRVPDSNYGCIVDAQGWGEEVMTLGYGNLLNGPTGKGRYTRTFGLTSAASAMVAAALVCAQGTRKAAGKTLWDSFDAREALLQTGSPQQWSGQPGTDRIGNRPDLRALIDRD